MTPSSLECLQPLAAFLHLPSALPQAPAPLWARRLAQSMPLPPVGVPPPPPPPSPPGPDSPEDVDVDAPPEIIEPSLPGEHAPVRDPQPPATMH